MIYYYYTDELDGIYEEVLGGLFLLACSLSSPLSFVLKYLYLPIYGYSCVCSEERRKERGKVARVTEVPAHLSES